MNKAEKTHLSIRIKVSALLQENEIPRVNKKCVKYASHQNMYNHIT